MDYKITDEGEGEFKLYEDNTIEIANLDNSMKKSDWRIELFILIVRPWLFICKYYENRAKGYSIKSSIKRARKGY